MVSPDQRTAGGDVAGPTFTVVTCHFGDPFWIEQLTASIDRSTTTTRVPEIVVVNQDRDPATARRLAVLPRVGRVLEYPPHHAQMATLGHDHPQALNRAVRESFTTSHVLVMDSDALPIGEEWLDRLSVELADGTCVFARDPSKWGLSHPCLMVLPVNVVGETDFADGCEELGIDTGRLVALQVSKAGRPVMMLQPARGFGGHHGFTYLGGSVYHHCSGSFGSSSDPRLTDQVVAADEEYFRRRIMEGRFHLSRREQWMRTTRGVILRVRVRLQHRR